MTREDMGGDVLSAWLDRAGARRSSPLMFTLVFRDGGRIAIPYARIASVTWSPTKTPRGKIRIYAEVHGGIYINIECDRGLQLFDQILSISVREVSEVEDGVQGITVSSGKERRSAGSPETDKGGM